ncbi:phosphoheptose isomerase [Fodinibius roseus]|uniref:Phosphoheptose isomerase n=1 Tax=Fodinibius roseus TaxID=1194090 RepID=A0A1M4YEZ4_9BACT|nr:SIS domain-containing protein [Fodinibius roseus]SHF04052.1 phosphoheptose isomerase [Fodinibius roseus]
MEKKSLSFEITSLIHNHEATVKQLYSLVDGLAEASERISSCIKDGGKIFWMGNGGSASACQHLAAEFVGRFQQDRAALPSIALTTDTSILTAISNDYGFESVFSRQIEALCTDRDIVIGLSTSGKSRNIIEGIKKANEMGALTIGLTGQESSPLAQIATRCLNMPSQNTARIQEMHLLCCHIICEIVENTIFDD